MARVEFGVVGDRIATRNHLMRRFILQKIDALPLVGDWRRHLIEERLWSHKRILFVNWIFQRLLGVNSDTPWSVHYTSCVSFPQHIQIERGVRRSFAFSIGCYFQGYNGIVIGQDTLFGPGVRVLSANHEIGGATEESPPIRIGHHCWLGANAILLPGVHLGDYSIVGAGAVVTSSYPDGRVVLIGIPARVLRMVDVGS